MTHRHIHNFCLTTDLIYQTYSCQKTYYHLENLSVFTKCVYKHTHTVEIILVVYPTIPVGLQNSHKTSFSLLSQKIIPKLSQKGLTGKGEWGQEKTTHNISSPDDLI